MLGAHVILTLDPGSFARGRVPISFQVPGAGAWELVDAAGKVLPVQVDGAGTAWAVVGPMEGARSASLQLRHPDPAAAAPHAVRARADADSIHVFVRGAEAFTYRTVPTELPQGRPDLKPIFRRGGYIHPVLTPKGRALTDDYPVNHKHHHGIWFAWTRVDFEGRKTDFWNMGEGKGTVEFVATDATWSGPVHGGFRARHRQVDLTSGVRRTAMDETWTVRAFDLGEASGVHVFDLVVTNSCVGGVPVRLPQYRYGSIGVRGHARWNDPAQMGFLNSEGMTDRSKGDRAETVGRWAVMHGPLSDGAHGGMAILGHPSNVNAPQPQRIHPTEPFLCLAPQQAGDLELQPGRPIVSRYRFVAFDGHPDPVLLEQLWRDYAEPPVVTLTVLP